MKKIVYALMFVLCSTFVMLFSADYATANTTLNVKFTKFESLFYETPDHNKIGTIPMDAPLILLDVLPEWAKVQYKSEIGYVKRAALKNATPHFLLVPAKQAPLIRVNDAAQSETVGTLPINTIVEAYTIPSEQFVFVRHGAVAGYVYKQALLTPTPKTRIVKALDGATIYTTPNQTSAKLGDVAAKTEVSMLATSNGWAFVTTGKESGYLLASQLGYPVEPVATPQVKPIQQVKQTATKKIALTFDDGPHPKVTTQILKTLAKYDAKATFFVVGNQVEKHPAVLKAIANDGHEIGSHTYSHAKLTTIPIKKAKEQIDAANAAIRAAIGKEATVFRPPYGAYNSTIKEYLNVPNVLWTIDTLDWQHHNPKKTLEAVKSNAKNGSIVLMHDIHQTTADALDSILETLQKQGYEFVTVSELLK